MLSNTGAANSGGADLNGITHEIIAAAIEVHRHLGPGLLESAYQECVCYELSQMGLSFTREVHLPLRYKGLQLDCNYRIDLLVEDAIVVELKSIEQILPIHSAQLLTYLKASHKQIGLLINFQCSHPEGRHQESRAGLRRACSASSRCGIDSRATLMPTESPGFSLRLSPRLCVSALKKPLNRKPL